MVKKGLPEEAAFEHRLKRGAEGICMALWGKSFSDKGTSKCKGPELELHVVCSRKLNSHCERTA